LRMAWEKLWSCWGRSGQKKSFTTSALPGKWLLQACQRGSNLRRIKTGFWRKSSRVLVTWWESQSPSASCHRSHSDQPSIQPIAIFLETPTSFATSRHCHQTSQQDSQQSDWCTSLR
jgi:hypothetical protein